MNYIFGRSSQGAYASFLGAGVKMQKFCSSFKQLSTKIDQKPNFLNVIYKKQVCILTQIDYVNFILPYGVLFFEMLLNTGPKYLSHKHTLNGRKMYSSQLIF